MKINRASLDNRERGIFDEARRMLADGTNALEFSSRFFGHDGLLSELGSDPHLLSSSQRLDVLG